MQIVHMQPLVSSLSASDRLVQPLYAGSYVAVLQTRGFAFRIKIHHSDPSVGQGRQNFRKLEQVCQPYCKMFREVEERKKQPISQRFYKDREKLQEKPLSGCTRRSLAESDDTRGCICIIYVVDLLMMSGLRSKHVEEFNLTL